MSAVDAAAKAWYQRMMNSYNSSGVKHVWPTFESLSPKEKDFWRGRAEMWNAEHTEMYGTPM